MEHLTIKNIGPISSVDITLNSINVFIGPQSSGKSTLAKIISYCSWVEKNSILESRNDDFKEKLMSFHNIDDAYFNSNSYLKYESNCCKIEAKGKEFKGKIEITLNKDGNKIFRNHKITYFPAERNFVAAIPSLGKYNEKNNNIISFLYEWYKAKQLYTQENSFTSPIPTLGNISYYYEKDKDIDNITLNNGESIRLQNSSSGLQSIIPLLIVWNYSLNNVFEEKRTRSPFEILHLEEKTKFLQEELILALNKIIKSQKEILKEYKNKNDIFSKQIHESILQQQEEIANLLGLYSEYHYSHLIVEEPEQNLFPETQRDLIYYLLHTLNNGRSNKLVITTHSPYILYALNNCMMGYLVKERLKDKQISSSKAWVDPNNVSVWEIHDGQLISIQEEKTKTLGKHYFNRNMNSIMDEYYLMLKYLKL